MTIHGDLYYEGKEFETRMKDKKPGDLSDDLRTSLGMPIGPNANRVPPPWLIAMQRYVNLIQNISKYIAIDDFSDNNIIT